MRITQLAVAWIAAALLLTGSANAALVAGLTNGDFEDYDDVSFNQWFDNTINTGWQEHEIYSGGGPNGNGTGIWTDDVVTGIPGTDAGGQLSLIATAAGPNQSTVMQSLGTVDASDIGKTFTFSAGAIAWDWLGDGRNYSGVVSASFREGMVPDPAFNFGTRLGTEDFIATSVSNGDGVQNGVGDDGPLAGLSATYTPITADIGKEVFAAINLNSLTVNAGENRYVVDNATLSSAPAVEGPGLATSLTNGDFETNNGAFFDPTVDGWDEHEIYNGAGPNGAGAGVWGTGGAASIPGTSGDQLSLIAGDGDANTSTVMQSLGLVNSSDVAKTFTLSAGAAAWDWHNDVKPFSGTVTLSFREGAAPDGAFSYGTLLGTEGSAFTEITGAGNAVQDGTGDDGGLIPLTATYIPDALDVGKEVFAVINLGGVIRAPVGESRFVVDNATLSVVPEPSTFVLLLVGLMGLVSVARRRP